MLIILSLIFCICGCEKKDPYANFEHYDLTKYDTTVRYIFAGESRIAQEYIVTDITPENSEAAFNGLFYKISDDDYILLDKIDSCYPTEYKKDSSNYFYLDKLYIIRCYGGTVSEYTLSGVETKKTDLISKFDTNLMLYSIHNIDKDYIYFGAKKGFDGPQQSIKCSKDNYKCELIDS